ncbi:MAG: hypothetical protein H3Z53_12390 [archaeon]|nr:hypothetical protein [archaeon]MCP8315148.1 hypothetical protein [archaeon]
MSEQELEIKITINIPKNLYKFYENFNLWTKAYYDVRAFIEDMIVNFLKDHAEEVTSDPTQEVDPEEVLKIYAIEADC